MTRDITLILFLLGISFPSVFSQTPIATVPVNQSRDIQFFSLGDSLLLIYSEPIKDDWQRVFKWIYEEKEQRIYLPTVDVAFLNLGGSGMNSYLYFIEKKQEIETIAAITMTVGKTGATRTGETLFLKGTYVGSFNAKYFYVISFDKDTEEFNIYVLDGMTFNRRIIPSSSHGEKLNAPGSAQEEPCAISCGLRDRMSEEDPDRVSAID